MKNYLKKSVVRNVVISRGTRSCTLENPTLSANYVVRHLKEDRK